MVPTEFRKALCILAGLVTLLEAIVWGATAVYSIGVYNCTWVFIGVEKGISIWTLLYLRYFMGGCRGEAEADQLGYSFNPPSTSSNNLLIWMWFYAIVSAAWIMACLLLIVGALCEVRGCKGALLYYPWIGLAGAIIGLDVIAALYHLVDVFQTMSPDDFADLYGSGTGNWNSLTRASDSNGVVTWMPSFYLTLFFCRLLVLWILNIYFLCTVKKASKFISQYKTKHLQASSGSVPERKKSWKDIFYEGPHPSEGQKQFTTATTSRKPDENEETKQRNPREEQKDIHLSRSDNGVGRQDHLPARYMTDRFGIPLEELDAEEQRIAYRESPERSPRTHRSHYQPTGRVRDYRSRPVTPDSFVKNARWQEVPPPISSGSIKVPVELNKFEPFSYTAGDQPQLIKRTNLSRSNSRAESQYPSIPRPDYTIADRRAASLEFVPNRFKVPAPRRPQSLYNASFESQALPSKKPQMYPRPLEDPRISPQTRVSRQTSYPHQPLQNNNYNINKLY